MSRTALALMLSLVLTRPAFTEEPAAFEREYEQLRKDRLQAWAAFQKEGRKASKAEDFQALAKKHPDLVWLPRLIDFAEKHATDPRAVLPALDVWHGGAPGQDPNIHERAIKLLVKHAGSKHLAGIVPTLTGQDETTARVLRAVVAKHPDPKTQARAARVLHRYLSDCDEKATEANLDAEYREKLEKQTSPQHVKDLIDRLHTNRKELRELKAVMEKHATLLPKLGVGFVLPDVAVIDLDGKKHKLKDYRGKVLLIHVFSIERNRCDWLYYVQQNNWSDEFKDRPIVRINISIDRDKETFTTWLRHHPLSDVNVWAGTESDFFADWLDEERSREQTYLVNAAGLIVMRSPATNDMFGPLDQKIQDLFTAMKVPPQPELKTPQVKDDKLSEAARAYEQLRLDFLYAGRRYGRAMLLARTEEEKRKAAQEYDWQSYAARSVELAEKYIKDPASFDMLAFRILRFARRHDDVDHDQALNLLGKYHADNPRMIELLRTTPFGYLTRAVFLNKVLDRNPDVKIQARACRMLKEFYETQAGSAERYLQADAQLQQAIRRRSGEAYIKELLEAMTKNQELRAKYIKLYKEKYEKVLPEFTVGKPILDAEFTTLEGKKVKLSELRGKIVYLNIFSVEENRPTFDRQREFAEKMKGKPFVIVNVSVDERKETFSDALARDPSPWINAWNGRRSELYADWMQQSHHTSYLIDSKGILRSHGIFWGDLPDTVADMLAEMERAKKR
jgi:hypothetical protein